MTGQVELTSRKKNGSKDAAADGKPSQDDKKKGSILNDAFDLFYCAGGIYACYIVYGLLHERIYGVEYGEDKEKFSHSLFLVLLQCLVNGALAFVKMIVMDGSAQSHIPAVEHFKIGFTYIGAMFASNYALNYVNYPTQALAKSCKMIPVMIMGILINGKRYKLREYGEVLLISIGISVFMMFKASKKAAAVDDDDASSWFGIFLLFLSLALDGFTGPNQERIIKKYQPTQNEIMAYMNLYAVLLVAVALVVSGRLFPAIEFCTMYPEVLLEIVVFCLCSALGQGFILNTVFRFNSLVLTTITTTRKFFTILASVVLMGHPLTSMQWVGVGLVFSGLGLNIIFKYQARQAHHKSIMHHGDSSNPAVDAKDVATHGGAHFKKKRSKKD